MKKKENKAQRPMMRPWAKKRYLKKRVTYFDGQTNRRTYPAIEMRWRQLNITNEDIVFRYGDTVYNNKCRDLPKFSNCIDQSIISGGMRERRRYRGEEEEEKERERGSQQRG